jgi:hypothetical protein
VPRKRTPNARKGPLTKAVRVLLDTVAQGIDSKADTKLAVKTLANELAPVMRRNPEALESRDFAAASRIAMQGIDGISPRPDL